MDSTVTERKVDMHVDMHSGRACCCCCSELRTSVALEHSGRLLLTALASSYHVSHTYMYTVNANPPHPRDRGGASGLPCSRLEYMHVGPGLETLNRFTDMQSLQPCWDLRELF